MSRRNLKGGAGSARSKEVSTIPMQVDLRVHDDVALDEIELYAEVLAPSRRATARSRRASSTRRWASGLRLRSLLSASRPSGLVTPTACSQACRYITSVDQRLKPSAVYILTAAVLSSST